MIKQTDIMLGPDDDLLIDGDLVLGESYLQEVGILIRLNPGELKADPVLGPGLIRMVNGKVNANEIKTVVKVHLERDGKNYEDAEKVLQLIAKTNG